MPDPLTLAGLLLVLGPILGAVPVANPSLIRIWSATREDHIATVGAHRRAWSALNAGFAFATITTTVGLALVALAHDSGSGSGAAQLGWAVAYAMGGVLWCIVLAARTRTTPALDDLIRLGVATEPAEKLVGAALGGVFSAFVLITATALAGLGITLLVGGGMTPLVGAFAFVLGAGAAIVLIATGDLIPALLYLPTIAIGLAVLAGWT